MEKADDIKILKTLVMLLIIIAVLLLVSFYVLFKPIVLGSPGEEVIEQDNLYLIGFISVLSLIFIVLIVMIVKKYVKVKSEKIEEEQSTTFRKCYRSPKEKKDL